jgi:LPXTG-site transpeptidase (sortase) family protein
VLTLAPTASPAAPEPTLSLSNTLVIPAINLEAPIVEVGYESQVIDGTSAITWAVPEFFAVGWHQSSAPPGQHGNTVLNGHEYIHGGVFQELVKLQEDDEIIVHSEGTAHHYRVSEQHIFKEEGQSLAVRVENAQWILPTEDERLTIVTCAPHKKSTHRLIVVAFPVDDEILSTP